LKTLAFVAMIGALASAGSAADAIATPLGSDGLSRQKADRIIVKKSERRLYLLAGDTPFRAYTIALGPNPEGHKFFSGDGRTPEGIYFIEQKNPASRFHLSLKISYPNAEDRRTSRAYGLSAGGLIMIHGLPPNPSASGAVFHPADWTEGCIAVTNSEIEEIWEAVDLGTVVEIQP
jgi:murein L,D-transpeptidase YafK